MNITEQFMDENKPYGDVCYFIPHQFLYRTDEVRRLLWKLTIDHQKRKIAIKDKERMAWNN